MGAAVEESPIEEIPRQHSELFEEDALMALARGLQELADCDPGSVYGSEDSHFCDLGPLGPPGPPEAFCDVPDCDGPNPSELWFDDSEQRGIGDLLDGLAGLGVVSLLLGMWWLAVKVVVGRRSPLFSSPLCMRWPRWLR